MRYENWIVGHTVELPEMLAGRERRAATQRRLLDIHQKTLVCFTLNIAGPVKVFPLAEDAFTLGRNRIEAALRARGVRVAETQVLFYQYGAEAYWVVGGNALAVKRILTEVEESSPLGRLFDIDVLTADGTKVSRRDIGYPPRTCLICGEPASDCAGGRVHTVAELQQKTVEIIAAELRRIGLSPHTVGRLCRMAMLWEVYTTPKPGLVDRNNTGSHRDMDVELFEKSSRALEGYFAACTEVGEEKHGLEPYSLLKYLRPLGREAERVMLETTGGVNTHKGMIFSLGILCGALGQFLGDHRKANVEGLCCRAGTVAMPALQRDLAGLEGREDLTAGERQYLAYGISGIRGEAASGFLSVQRYALPVLRHELAAGADLSRAGSLALLSLIAHVTDTNMIARSSREVHRELQEKTAALLAGPEPPSEEAIRALDAEFIARNVSPGGCADLLALAYFLLFWEELETG